MSTFLAQLSKFELKTGPVGSLIEEIKVRMVHKFEHF